MRKLGCALLFFVVLVLGLSLMVPGEDLAETAYYESEPLPYESTPLCSNVLAQAAASAIGVVRIGVRLRSRTLVRCSITLFAARDSHRLANERHALALLCSLLC